MLPSDQLFHVELLLAHGNYAACLAAATPLLVLPPASPEDSALLATALRAHLALPSPPAAYADLVAHAAAAAADEDPTLRAVTLLARLSAAAADDDDDREAVLEQARDLAIELEDAAGAGTAKAVVGTVFVKAGEWVEAVDVLQSEAESLECAAVLVQVYLQIDRPDMARKVYDAARAYGDDAQLVQQIEAWLGLRTQGPSLQHAYYFYDELLQTPSSTRAPALLAAHGAAHALLGHADEARADVEQALALAAPPPAGGEQPQTPAVVALGSAVFEGERADLFAQQLAALAPAHPQVVDLAAKARAFDAAAAKFAVAASA